MNLKVKNGYYSYDKKCRKNEKYVLEDINFSVDQGEVFTILGANGVGKTTLIKCILGLLSWEKGASYLDNKDIKEFEAKELWKHIAYVPQAKTSTFSYRVEEMVVLGRSAHIGQFALPNDKDYEQVDEILKSLGIFHLKGRDCNALSGGELQMVLIARALCANPNILVLDEPESNLDFKNQLYILETLKNLSKEKNVTIIINTHYPDHALQISDKTLLLGHGIQKFGKTCDIINEENLEEIFNVKIYIRQVEVTKEKSYKTVIADLKNN